MKNRVVDECRTLLRVARTVANSEGKIASTIPIVTELANILSDANASLKHSNQKWERSIANDNKSSFQMQAGKELEKFT